MISEVITPIQPLRIITQLAQLEDRNAVSKHLMIDKIGAVQYLGEHPNAQLRQEGYLQFRGLREGSLVYYSIRRKDLEDTPSGISLMQDSLYGIIFAEENQPEEETL